MHAHTHADAQAARPADGMRRGFCSRAAVQLCSGCAPRRGYGPANRPLPPRGSKMFLRGDSVIIVLRNPK